MADEQPSPAPRIGVPVDLESVVRHASDVADQLDRRWHDALEALHGSEAHLELTARWSAVMTAISESVDSLQRDLDQLGYDIRLNEPPPFPSHVGVLSSTQTGAEVDLRLSLMGLLIGFETFARAAGSLFSAEGTASPVPAVTELRSFAAIQNRARLVSRLTVEAEQGIAALQSRAERFQLVPESIRRLELADLSWKGGEVEAAAFHLIVSTRAMINEFADSPDWSRLPPLSHVLRQGGLQDLSSLIAVCEDLFEKVGSGDPPKIAPASFVVPNLITELRRVAARPPIGQVTDAVRELLAEPT